MFSILADPLLNLIYPHDCRSCGSIVSQHSDGAACRACWTDTRVFGDDDPLCHKCGVLLDGVAVEAVSACKTCDDHHYDRAASAGVYEKALAASVLELKQSPKVSRTVHRLLTQAFDRMNLPGELTIIPVPLSKQRLVERGFNQASALARVIAGHSRQPLDEHSLIRRRDTPMHRAAMDRKARENSVKNAFAVVRPKLIDAKNILLIDDVMTSGATVSYCAIALKKSGAARVDVLTLAHAV